MNKLKFVVMRRLAELAMGKNMKDQIKRFGPLAAGILLVVAGVLRLAGQLSHADAVEQIVSWFGFQSGIAPAEVAALGTLAVGLGLKLWNLCLAPLPAPVLTTEDQMSDFVERYKALLASMPWDEARKMALHSVLIDAKANADRIER
jgi:hypothetical protein